MFYRIRRRSACLWHLLLDATRTSGEPRSSNGASTIPVRAPAAEWWTMTRHIAHFATFAIAAAVLTSPNDANAWTQHIPGVACTIQSASNWDYGGEGNIFFYAGSYVNANCPFSYDSDNPDSKVTAIYVDTYESTSASGEVCAEACSVAYNGTSGTCSSPVCNGSGAGWHNLAPTFSSWSSDTSNLSYTSVDVYVTGATGAGYINGVFIVR